MPRAFTQSEFHYRGRHRPIQWASSWQKFLVAEGNQKSAERARSGIGARRQDFQIIRDNPLGRITVKKAAYGDKGSVKASTMATSQPQFRVGRQKSAVSFASLPQVKSSRTPDSKQSHNGNWKGKNSAKLMYASKVYRLHHLGKKKEKKKLLTISCDESLKSLCITLK